MDKVGRALTRTEPEEVTEVEVAPRRMSLRALMHFLFERAGFNRWSPAMQGKRNQAVLHKYLREAAEGVAVKGVALVDRLYVPEPFSEAAMAELAQRRRDKLSVLRPREGHSPLAVVIGEFKTSEVTPLGRRLWIKLWPPERTCMNLAGPKMLMDWPAFEGLFRGIGCPELIRDRGCQISIWSFER